MQGVPCCNYDESKKTLQKVSGILACKHFNCWRSQEWQPLNKFKHDPTLAKHLSSSTRTTQTQRPDKILPSTATRGPASQSFNLPQHSISLWDVQETSDRQNTQILFAHLLFLLIPVNPNHVSSCLLRDSVSPLHGLGDATVLPSKQEHQALDMGPQKERDHSRSVAFKNQKPKTQATYYC